MNNFFSNKVKGGLIKALILFFILPASLLARVCKVDGISHSPQKLNCFVNNGNGSNAIILKCVDGRYFLERGSKSSIVEVAYHEEVEEGPNPLVFLAEGIKLTVIFHDTYGLASLSIQGEKLKGLCF